MSSRPPSPRPGRTAIIVLAGIAVLLLAAGLVWHRTPQHSYTDFRDQLAAGKLARVTIDPGDDTAHVVPERGEAYDTGIPDNAGALADDLRAHDVDVTIQGTGGGSLRTALLILLPFALLAALAVFVLRRMSRGGAGGILQMRKSQARVLDPEHPQVTFADVAGAEEAVEDLQQIRAFLTDSRRFRALGARIPKGVLLLGPPGTGKTLLARAVAGEAGVPFFSASGSDFVEMFVGVGASRVRDLFQRAAAQAPSIVFLDEIDAVGRQRGAGMGGGNDEREQTLNQLLVELDGFEPNDRVIVIAATNRPDVLDPALLRPGRFGRHITVDRPDRAGREQILAVHTRGKPLAADIDLAALAAQTPGFAGADLADLVNEAALLAARERRTSIGAADLDEAILRVLAGPERRARRLSEPERLVTAYHEIGHALVGHLLEHADPVRKVSIVARGRALGLTLSGSEEDTYLTTEHQLAHGMAMALGGRTAEELVFGEVTSGAADDLDRVTSTAKRMVMRFAMGEGLPARTFGGDPDQPFLGRSAGTTETDYSEQVAERIDAEISRAVEHAHDLARDVLTRHRDRLDRAARRLMEQERLEGEALWALLDGRPAPAPVADAAPEPRPRRATGPRPSPWPGLATIRGDG